TLSRLKPNDEPRLFITPKTRKGILLMFTTAFTALSTLSLKRLLATSYPNKHTLLPASTSALFIFRPERNVNPFNSKKFSSLPNIKTLGVVFLFPDETILLLFPKTEILL